MTKPVKFVDA